MNGWVVLLWSAAAVLVLVVAGVFVSLIAMDRISFGGEAGPTATAPQVTGKVDTSYAVMILNGTPDEGLGVQVRQQVIDAGWAADAVLSSASTSKDFEKTTVFYSTAADQSAALGLADLIGGAAVVQDSYYDELNGSGGKQLTVVIGVDRSGGSAK